MTQEQAKYDITPDQTETPNLRFCPFASAVTPGPLGKLTFHRPPCDPQHCALGDDHNQSCKLWRIPDRLVYLETIAHSLSKNP